MKRLTLQAHVFLLGKSLLLSEKVPINPGNYLYEGAHNSSGG